MLPFWPIFSKMKEYISSTEESKNGRTRIAHSVGCMPCHAPVLRSNPGTTWGEVSVLWGLSLLLPLYLDGKKMKKKFPGMVKSFMHKPPVLQNKLSKKQKFQQINTSFLFLKTFSLSWRTQLACLVRDLNHKTLPFLLGALSDYIYLRQPLLYFLKIFPKLKEMKFFS